MISLVKPVVGEEEKQILADVIDSRILVSGKYVEDFEKQCAAKWGTKFGIAVSNGTTALHAMLLASGIKPGDQILTTPFSFVATANSILYCGAEPLFADIDPDTYNISPDTAEQMLKKNKKIKAILLVHLYGTPCDMDAFMYLKKKYGVMIFEDCAQAHEAKYKGNCVGSFGSASGFSFYATKNMTTGEGGIVLTDSPKINILCRQIVNHGRADQSTHTLLGFNFRLTNLAASIGLIQLKKITKWNEQRRNNAAYLSAGITGVPFIKTPAIPADTEPVFHQYTIRVSSRLREKLMAYLKEHGIASGIYYPRTMYNQPLYRKLGYKPGICPEAEKAAREVLSLPVHPSLTEHDLAEIVSVTRKFGELHG
jgi:dTDP-4-amino-4,6-dideoxygalactose transaminase